MVTLFSLFTAFVLILTPASARQQLYLYAPDSNPASRFAVNGYLGDLYTGQANQLQLPTGSISVAQSRTWSTGVFTNGNFQAGDYTVHFRCTSTQPGFVWMTLNSAEVLGGQVESLPGAPASKILLTDCSHTETLVLTHLDAYSLHGTRTFQLSVQGSSGMVLSLGNETYLEVPALACVPVARHAC